MRRVVVLGMCLTWCASLWAAPEGAKKKGHAPSAPVGKKIEGPAGSVPKDGDCPEEHHLARKGSVLRMGPGPNFAVFKVIAEERCYPRIRESGDAGWILMETEQGKGGWFKLDSRLLETGNPPPIPEGDPLFEALVVEASVAQSEPSLLAPISGLTVKGDVLQVYEFSEDGLFLLARRDGVPLGWVLKLTTQHSLDLEERVGGSRPWAPPPPPPERIPEGSPDALGLKVELPDAVPAPVDPNAPPADPNAPPAAIPDEKNPKESLTAAAPPPPKEHKKSIKDILGIRNGRPIGRGLTIGAGLGGTYFYQRFVSNGFNDPVANYRLDVVMASLALDFEYQAPFGLVVGGRYGGHGYAYTDWVPPGMERLPAPFGYAGRESPNLVCNYAQTGILAEICPWPSTVQSLHLYGGWRVYGSPDLDLSVRLGAVTDFVLFGKPGNAEPTADLLYAGLRPSARLVWRPWAGKFGALNTDVGMGAGFVVPMVLRPPNNQVGAIPRAVDIFESTYRLQLVDGENKMVRTGYSRPPNFIGLDTRAGYLVEFPFVQLEVGLNAVFRYYGVFYTQREGFSKRNRCCETGYYDRATNIDLMVGPYLMTRLAL